MKVITSFSGRLYYTTGMDALRSMSRLNIPLLAYAEDSVEGLRPASGRTICEADKVDAVYRDIFKCDPELSAILSYDEWKEHRGKYFNVNAPYWFRKVSCIRDALRTHGPDLYLWLDCDAFVKEMFNSSILDYAMSQDICYIDRVRMSTDTGVLFLNGHNRGTHEFVEQWYDMYRSRRVFTECDPWDDTQTFDYVRKNNVVPGLHFGPLQSGKGRELWFNRGAPQVRKRREWDCEHDWRYILHLKRPLKKVRQVTNAPVKANLGQLYVAFGNEYDNLAAHSARYARRSSAYPIHVLTNLPYGCRSKVWDEVENVTFRYFDMANEDNREIKTALSFYSPFEYTIYTDADSLVLRSFEDVLNGLSRHDVLLPVYERNVTMRTINSFQRPAFEAMFKKRPDLNGVLPFTIYGGGVCAFRRSENTMQFFNTWNMLYQEIGVGRDMPSLAMAARRFDASVIGELSKEYNRHESGIVRSFHGNKTSPHLPSYTPYRPSSTDMSFHHEPKVGR